jgi:hypothetical protein
MHESNGALSPLQAAAEIGRVAQWSEKLSGRIEGLTWMFWGVVSAAIFTSYAFAASTSERVPPWIGVLWVPWVTVGLLFTTPLWRAAGVVIQHPLASSAKRTISCRKCPNTARIIVVDTGAF